MPCPILFVVQVELRDCKWEWETVSGSAGVREEIREGVGVGVGVGVEVEWWE